MTRNKNRIYIAFHARTGHDGFHTAILVSPKNPKPRRNSTWRLHVTNRINLDMASQQEWVYAPLLVKGRTVFLLALVLLGKTKAKGQELSEMLRAVEVIQDNANWTCRTWTLSAVQYMLNQGVIPPISITLESLFNSGSQAALQSSNVPAAQRNVAPVPTLNTVGESIESELYLPLLV